MSVRSTKGAVLGPYKGPESYEVRDAYLFEGREREAHDVIALVLSSRLALLHAASGAGKTSLLNARVLPGLEELGWLPVRVRPGFHPVGAIKTETLKRAILCPALEAAAVERVAGELGVDRRAPLADLLAAYRDVPPADDRKRTLLEPLASPVPGFGTVAPFFHGWLQQNIDPATYAGHLRAVLGDGPERPAVTELETSVEAFADSLSSPESDDRYLTLLAQVNVPAIPLAPFFENLTAVLSPRQPELSLVLVLDQFEELFTRFVDPGPAPAEAPQEVVQRRREQPDWRLRFRFFEELGELYRLAETPSGGEDRVLPIRYLISLRDDYYAKLGPLRKFAGDLDRSAYHLEMLGREAAAAAIREPAKEYRYGYSEDLFQRILDELTREDRYIEPAHLQMVCSKLWRESGRELSLQAQTTGSESTEMDVGELERLKGTAGIFDSVLNDFLEDVLKTEPERHEAIDLLEPLITGSFTRNIVERDSLIRAPFKDAALRERILGELETARIVRVETRHDGYFVEITHEFLIPAILGLSSKRGDDRRYLRTETALMSLSRLEDQDLTGRFVGLLSENEFQALHQNQDTLHWPDWGVEAMLRSAVGVGVEAEAVRHWADRFEAECTVAPIAEMPARLRELAERDARLNLDELAVVTEADRDGASEERPEWSDRELELILRSAIVRAPETRSADVVHWTLRHGETDA